MSVQDVTVSGAIPWASKVRQHEVVAAADPRLAFDLSVFEDPGELTAHLAARPDTVVVLRPEISQDVGSAVLCRAGDPLPEAEIASLWRRGRRVVAHDHVPGEPYFVNGVVIGGRLSLTDCWRCFSLREGARSLLTSVVNITHESLVVRELTRRLQPVVVAAGLGHGPATFEVVLSPDALKVVKFSARAAGPPLPHLCRMLGRPDQAAVLASGGPPVAVRSPDPVFVADYAFVARRTGRLLRIDGLAEIRAMPSYAEDVFMPAPGDLVSRTTGEGGAAAILLRHRDEQVLLRDIAFCQRRNREGIFALAQDAPGPERTRIFAGPPSPLGPSSSL